MMPPTSTPRARLHKTPRLCIRCPSLAVAAADIYIDIDAARAGSEARFLNDFHGHPTAERPNCQFWPYYDEVTGERRMGVKTIEPVDAGAELLVDYGGKYFQPDGDGGKSDSDMHDSDEEFEVRSKPKKKRQKKLPKGK